MPLPTAELKMHAILTPLPAATFFQLKHLTLPDSKILDWSKLKGDCRRQDNGTKKTKTKCVCETLIP